VVPGATANVERHPPQLARKFEIFVFRAMSILIRFLSRAAASSAPSTSSSSHQALSSNTTSTASNTAKPQQKFRRTCQVCGEKKCPDGGASSWKRCQQRCRFCGRFTIKHPNPPPGEELCRGPLSSEAKRRTRAQDIDTCLG